MIDIRMIAYDLDGTLLTEKKELTERTRVILEKAAGMGITLVAATGRALIGIPDDVKNLSGADYFITANGAGVYERIQNTDSAADRNTSAATGEQTAGSGQLTAGGRHARPNTGYRRILERNIDRQRGLELMRELSKLRVMPDPFIDGKCYMLADKAYLVDNMDVTPEMKDYIRSSRTLMHDMEAFLADKDMQKITINFATDSSGHRIDYEPVREIVKKYPDFNAVTGGIRNLEISDITATKGDAMLWLAERLDIKADEIVSFGDSENDITMLQLAGRGVAMANALDDVKKATDIITLSNDDDGVADYLERLLLS